MGIGVVAAAGEAGVDAVGALASGTCPNAVPASITAKIPSRAIRRSRFDIGNLCFFHVLHLQNASFADFNFELIALSALDVLVIEP
jgi:hypothetical protein